ncbi:MAG: hypothetical protein JWQ96_2900 [Segetibacter sp.]|nr:hypothetical protein [Segetibacter sp.]
MFKPFESPLNFTIALSPSSAGTTSSLCSTVVNYDLNAGVANATGNAFSGSIINTILINQVAIRAINPILINR